MKNIIISLFLFCIVITSCKKDANNNSQSSKKLYTVTFNAGNFIQQHTSITNSLVRTNAVRLADYPTGADTSTANPIIYASIGPNTVEQTSSDPNFGTITTQLPAGTYSVFIIGGEESTDLLLSYSTTTQDFTYDNVAGDGLNDLFFKKFTITVGSSGINQNISLNRIVGKLDVVVQDSPPAGFNHFELTVSSYALSYNINSGPVVLVGNYKQGLQGISTASGIDVSSFILDTTTPFNVTIAAVDNAGVTAYSKTISNVSFPANTDVVLSGYLFGGNGTGNGITVGADTTWNATTINYVF